MNVLTFGIYVELNNSQAAGNYYIDKTSIDEHGVYHTYKKQNDQFILSDRTGSVLLANTINNSVIAYAGIDIPTLDEFFTGNSSGLLFLNPDSLIGVDIPAGNAKQENWSGYKLSWEKNWIKSNELTTDLKINGVVPGLNKIYNKDTTLTVVLFDYPQQTE